MPESSDVEVAVRSFLGEIGRLPDTFDATTPLYADGAGLDSLETAELSARLEDDFGTDPYSAGQIPETLGQIIAFYDAAGQ